MSTHNIQVEPDHYYNQIYDNKDRFNSYWHQINEILQTNPKKVLEIGIGNRFVSNYLKSRGVNITTLDTDKRLKPDVVGNILNMPFDNNSYDVIACFEVLEHLPFNKFFSALEEMKRVSSKYVLISLPDVTPEYKLSLHVPFICAIDLMIASPIKFPKVHKFDGQHYWEIGKKNYSFQVIRKEIIAAKYKILKTYRPKENMYHRFILLTK